jgi:transposase
VLTLEEWMDAKSLLKQGLSQREVARRMGCSRNTVAKLAQQKAPQPYQRPPRPSKLDPFKPYLQRRFQEYPLSNVRLLAEIQPMGYTGSIDLLRRFLTPLRREQKLRAKATVRFETPPGHQAQVDWAHCGRFRKADGAEVAVYCFTMVLGFSRMLFVEFTASMDLPTLMRCHVHAFEFFGGWPREVLYDNMAQVRLPTGSWNPLFADFAHHYGFTPRTCRPYRPRTKGKVERVIGYVRSNFLAGRSFVDSSDLNVQAHHWLTHTANERVHATTAKKPVELFAREGLTPLSGVRPYPLEAVCLRKVDAEGFVHWERSRYSAPPEQVGKTLVVEAGAHTVTLRSADLVIAEHPRAEQPGSCVVRKEHVAAFWKLSLPGSSEPPSVPAWQLTFQDAVAVTPLSRYEELAAQGGSR